jgi:hypothetical protein
VIRFSFLQRDHQGQSRGAGGRTQHGPQRDGRRVFDVLHHSKPVPLVEADVVGRMRFEVATCPLFVRAGENRCQERAANSASLMGRVDADRRQKPMRADRIALVKPPLHLIELLDFAPKGPKKSAPGNARGMGIPAENKP